MNLSFVLFSAHLCAGSAAAAMVWGVPFDLLKVWRLHPVRTALFWASGATAIIALPAPWGEGMLVASLLHTLAMAWRSALGLKNWGQQDPVRTSEQQARLMDLRGQLARLHEQERMAIRIQQTETEKKTLVDSYRRFDAILMTTEQHLALGDTERAERLITLFGKHLRGVLNEASSPFIRLNDTLEAIRNYLSLMEALTDERLLIDLDDGMIEPENGVRMTRNMEITPWVEAQTWPLFESAERLTEVAEPHLITADLEGGEVVFRLDGGPGLRLKLMGSAAKRA
jgi:hypothetical protein